MLVVVVVVGAVVVVVVVVAVRAATDQTEQGVAFERALGSNCAFQP